MFDPQATIAEALAQTGKIDQALLTIAARDMSMCWHDPIAVELQRRLAEPLLRHISTDDLIKLLDIQDVGGVINDTILQHLS